MQTDPRISFQGFDADASVRRLVEDQVQRLERHSGRITSVRVVVGAHERRGGTYEVRIEVILPGTELIVAPDAHPGPLTTAIRDTFAVASLRMAHWAERRREARRVPPSPAGWEA